MADRPTLMRTVIGSMALGGAGGLAVEIWRSRHGVRVSRRSALASTTPVRDAAGVPAGAPMIAALLVLALGAGIAVGALLEHDGHRGVSVTIAQSQSVTGWPTCPPDNKHGGKK
jgi:hypothetical protein